jgi:hypothetical protein
MTSKELYYQFHLLLNENANFKNVKISEGNFVLLFNRCAERWLNISIDLWMKDEDILNLQEFIKNDEKLDFYETVEKDSVIQYKYKIPADYFTWVDSHSLVHKDCSLYLTNYFVKPRDVRIYLSDGFPSLEYEEGLCNISNNFLIVYAKDFTVSTTYLSYFKNPPKIDIEGYENLKGEKSKNIDSAISDVYLNQMLDMCVTEVQREFKDQLGFQVSKERETENK